jgi:nucleoside-diphosphate-sugar epimerase
MNFNIANFFYQEDLSTVAAFDFIDWDKLENMSVLITGATGLICSFLIDVLMYRNLYYGNNISIWGLGRNLNNARDRFGAYWKHPLFKFITQDIIEKINLDENIDYIIHGASNAYPASFTADPVGTMKANILGLSNLLDFGIKTNCKRILYISSGEVYGEGDGNDFTESYSGYIDYLNPRSCYPAGKRAAETLCIAYSFQYNINTVIARPCHIYGPTITNSDNRAFAQFVRDVLAKKDVVLKSMGKQYRSYCYVADCVSALLTVLMSRKNGNAYNIANKGSNVSIAELADYIALSGNRKVVFDIPTNEEQRGYSLISRAVLDAGKLESLGWKAKYTLPEGIKRTIQILSENR